MANDRRGDMVHGGHDGPRVGLVDMAVRVGDLKGGGKTGRRGGGWVNKAIGWRIAFGTKMSLKNISRCPPKGQRERTLANWSQVLLNSRFSKIVTSLPTTRPPASMVRSHFRL